MRKILILIVGILLGSYLLSSKENSADHAFALPSPTPSKIYKNVEVEGDKYAYDIFKVSSLPNLKIITNYLEKRSTAIMVDEYKCNNYINGGFYAENDRPLGLVVIDGTELWPSRANRLFNGYLSFNANTAVIGLNPLADAKYAMQTGPLLMLDQKTIDLQLSDDKLARRMFAAQTESDLIFGTVFNADATILGPRLDDLPVIVEKISESENLSIINAINLDGGRASTFHSSDLTLPEVTWVGSLFCSL